MSPAPLKKEFFEKEFKKVFAAKPGRKPNSRANMDALLKASEPCVEACARAKREQRPIEFPIPTSVMGVFVRRWAWPDGTVTSPESLRQRMRNLKFGRAKHGEVMTGLNHPVTVHNDL